MNEEAAYNASQKILLVGEDNPYGNDPVFALYPRPDGCSGHRLMGILGLSEREYLWLQRGNLCNTGAWSNKEAERRAQMIIADPSAPWRTIVMLGQKVAKAFCGAPIGFFRFVTLHHAATGTDYTAVSLPHPSGRNRRLWTEQAILQARGIMRGLAPEIAWGGAS